MTVDAAASEPGRRTVTPTSILEERTARRLTPALFLLAILCFFFTFAGVSCNTDQAKATLHGAAGLSGGNVNLAQLDRCLDALKGDNLFSYTGFNLAFGTAPSGLASTPATCTSGASALPGSSSALPVGSQATLGVQPLELLALIAIMGGALAGLLALLRPWRVPWRASTATVLSIVALVLLLLEQAHAHTAVIDKISSASTGAGVPFSLSAYIDFNSGLAYLIALIVLGVAALYNASSALLGVGRMTEEIRPPPPPPAEPEAGQRTPAAG